MRPAINRITRPPRFEHDFETFSKLDLKRVGLSRYARHESTEVLMLAWARDNGEVKQWVPAEFGGSLPAEVEDAILDERILKVAFNAQFERAIWRHVMGIDPGSALHWRCHQVLAYTMSLPGNLEGAGKVVGLESDKAKSSEGKRLVRMFTQPRSPTKNNVASRLNFVTNPDEWEEFKAYNRQDVIAERAFWRKSWRFDLPPHEWEMWAQDQEQNEAGLPVNMKTVRNVLHVINDVMAGYLAEMKEITGLDNPNSQQQLLAWLKSEGYVYDDLKKGNVGKAWRFLIDGGEEDSPMARVLFLRQRVSKTSVKKYQALADGTDEDDRLRYTIQFAGAGRTWRYSGRRFQTQNLSRPAYAYKEHDVQIEAIRWLEHMDAEELQHFYGDDIIDVLATGVRPVVQAPPGYTFVIRDLNAIENRVLGWMASDDKILGVFRKNRDPYIDFATYMYGSTYDDEWKLYKELKDDTHRTTAKPGVLGCGYMLGAGQKFEKKTTGEIEATGLLGYAWAMGITEFTPEQSELSVRVWRQTFQGAVDFWWAIDKAFRECVRTEEPSECWPVRFDKLGPMTRMHLPSGRCLHYVNAHFESSPHKHGEAWMFKPGAILSDAQRMMVEREEARVLIEGNQRMWTAIVYKGLVKNQWGRVPTHPGKMTENADQAISRDLLNNGMRLLYERYGYLTLLHAHDELVIMVPEKEGEIALKRMEEAMNEPPKWAPDIPLGSLGFCSRYYVKG